MVHAENGDAADLLQQEALARGCTAPKFHAATRPGIEERSALQQNVDDTLYEGRTISGVPKLVTLRGQVIVEDRQYVGQSGSGRFVARAPYVG